METFSQGKVSAGRVMLPDSMRKELGIHDGSDVVFSRTSHGIEIKTLAEVVRQAQERFARLRQPGVSVVDELIRERREAADRE